MVYSKPISLNERERELKRLVEDAEILGFSLSLIRDYKTQLSEIQRERRDIKEKNKTRREELKELNKVSPIGNYL